MNQLEIDEFYMDKALELAIKGMGKTNPNPIVGSIIVKENKIIGKGYHEHYGQAHAERNAIKNAIDDVSGSTIYINLEPCAHYGKTPPCVDLIIEKKIKRVVIGMLDPNPLVAGKSIEKLRKNNIEVIVGIREEECRKINEIFIKYITSKLPYVIIKSGISLDGKIATYTGESKWITSKDSRIHGHELRNKMTGIMVGINTIVLDNPMLTYRGEKEGRNPIRIVLDSNLRIPIESNVIRYNNGNTIVACIKNSNNSKKIFLENIGIKIIETNEDDGEVDLKELMKKLAEEKIDSILLEGGGTLNYSALKKGIVDKVRFYIAPKIIGGEKSKNSVGGQGFEKLEQCINLKNISCFNIGEEIVVEGYVSKEDEICLQE